MKSKWVIGLILFIALGLRTVALDKFPSGLNADEAALGYNAYSLATTAKDEHGNFMPINLESFGDYKPALYAYILIPFVKVLGMTEFAVRLPSALMGVAGIGLIYLLTKELMEEKTALLAAVVLTVSPWHLHFSRGAWETNLATTLITLGVWAFVRWLKTSQSKELIIAVVSFGASMYAYQSARIIAPLLGIGMLILFYKKFLLHKSHVIKAGAVLLVLLIPLGISVLRTNAASRLSGVGWLADEGPVNRVKEIRGHYSLTNPPIWAKLLYNRPVIYTLQLAQNYLSHFDGNFLFVNGDSIERNKVPETGLLYLTDWIILLVGVFYLLRKPTGEGDYSKILWLWIGVSVVASAMTFQVPHALRAQNLIIPTAILVAVGFTHLTSYFKFGLLKYLLLGVLVSVYGWQFTRYLHEYYIHYPKEYPAAWGYGFSELVSYVESEKDKYEKVLITDKYDQPYILFLFYSKYPPQKFQGQHELTFRDRFNFSTVRDYDKYHFSSTSWEKVRDIHSTLIVAAPEDIPDVGVHVVKTINFPSRQPAFKIVSN